MKTHKENVVWQVVYKAGGLVLWLAMYSGTSK